MCFGSQSRLGCALTDKLFGIHKEKPFCPVIGSFVTKDRDRNNFLFLADHTRCAQTKDLPKIGSYFGHDPNSGIYFRFLVNSG